jgi:hypothetical protein
MRLLVMSRVNETALLIAIGTDLLGSRDALRNALDAGQSEFDSWVAGTAAPQGATYLKLLKLVVELQKARVTEQNRRWAKLHAELSKG